MPDLVWGLDSYVSDSTPLAAMRMVNCYFEKQPEGAKSQTPIFGSPGLTKWIELPEFPIRGLWPFQGQMYAVAGQGLYRINRVGGFKKLGGGIFGSGVVSMSNNATQLMVVNGVGGYLVDNADQYQQIQNANFYSANTIQYFDNYFLFDRRLTNELFFSGLSDGTSYTGTDFASAEAKPGFLTAIKENLQLIFLFCQNHIELWYDAGASDNPFQRYAGGVIERGCVSPAAIINQDDAIFFLGNDRVFYRLQGNVPMRISTHAIEQAWQKYGNISDASCLTYTWKGHKMVHLNFPSVPHTWVFDISTSRWHERESLDAKAKSLGRWRGNSACEIYDKVMIGDAFSGKIFYLDPDNYTEDGLVVPFLTHSVTTHADKRRLFVNRLELDMESGVAPATGIGSTPNALLRYSKDGGKSWSRIQPGRSTGRVGENLRRQRWLALGQAYQWTFELLITDPVRRVLIAAHLDTEVGMD